MNKQHPLYQEDLQHILSTKRIDTLKDKTILITGATGLIGMHLIDALMKLDGARIIAIGRSKEKAAARLGEYYNNERFTFIEQDVCTPFSNEIHADYVIPLASNTHPKAYSEYPTETVLINTLGCQYALELARRCKATVLYPSSVEIYGNARGTDVFTEDYTGELNLKNARSCYPESKRVSEALCLSYAAEYGIDVKIARLSRVFGPTILQTDTKASSQFIQKAIAQEDIVLKSEGTQFFSYTYTTDAVAAILHIMLNGESATAYNIANDDCNIHLRDFAKLCAEHAGTKVIFDLPEETERRGYSIATQAILDNKRLTDCGWEPSYNIQEAISRTIEILK